MRKSLALVLTLPLLAAPVLVTPAQAQEVVDRKKLERDIERSFKQQRNIRVDAKCPKGVSWVRGKVFYCRVVASDGSKGRIKAKIVSNPTAGLIRWKLV